MRKRDLLVVGLAAAALTGCGAPGQPAAEPGKAATLSEDVIPYDTTVFMTNRNPVLPADGGCGPVTRDFLVQIGMTLDKYEKPSTDSSGKTCSIYTRDAQLQVASAHKPFGDYWRSRASETSDPAATSSLGGFRRFILQGTYYAVEYPDKYNETYRSSPRKCNLAIDTGAPVPLTLTYTGTETTEFRQTCASAEKYATALLSKLDPGGGSRVG
ncbi:hypothetical protein GCM10010174_85420 [Kutzneria viridogrisea]|uniref:DUF3558 domain-containing protein n=2 Tax=Kutzneria TaxID=43356 RepID=A0ABR6BVQ7_9PSEU|nr:DUF3558 family protein [Kutzneria albida]AHH93991.1 putative secreted protein [Kutzneria albida DSM 43870]MBA8931004.1 hypothetical protein [Kutzneria viridogrisea]